MSFRYFYAGNWDFKGELAGVHAFRFDTETGLAAENGVWGEQTGQSILAVLGDSMISVCELGNGGHVVSYRMEKDGTLTVKDVLDTDSAKLSYVSADPLGKYVFVSSMGDGTVKMIAVGDEAKLTLADEYRLTGHSLTPRQVQAKVHSVKPSPDGRFLAAANLGADELDIFAVDREKERLRLVSTMPVDWGKEPRHMAFSPDGSFLYLLTEAGNRLYVYGFGEGILTERASYNTLNPAEKPAGAAADIAVTADGKMIYTTNRGQSNIALWKVLESGLLDITGFYECGGSSPRGLCLSPDEEELFCANDESGTVAVIKRDRETGALGPVLQTFPVKKAGCVRVI